MAVQLAAPRSQLFLHDSSLSGSAAALGEESLTTVPAHGTRSPSSADSITKRAAGALLTGSAGVRQAGRAHKVGGMVHKLNAGPGG